ncbi:MAG: hypothetical protein F9K40_04070 [Kofleriaceae bacterium]|nr:MAG: hypothetical protein F9K40_04070 [Kofleriaceae bacterium]MBZ0233567.1 retropepsin-like domain-containing protein [Kofleriaceae bacterium]
MKVARFDPSRELIVVDAQVWGPGGREKRTLALALDTASSETVIMPEIIDELGYSPRDGEQITSVRAAIGKEQGYTLRVARFASLGFAVPDFRIHVFDLATGWGIDGLVGLSFLRQFNYQVRSAEGRILVERTAT